MAKVTIDNLAEEVAKMLDEYAGEVTDNVKEATHKVALLTVRAMKQESKKVVKAKKKPRKKGSKQYHSGWRTFSITTRLSQEETIYNKDLPGIPHLLEFGHALRDGGRTRSLVHIEPVAKEAESLMVRELEARLK